MTACYDLHQVFTAVLMGGFLGVVLAVYGMVLIQHNARPRRSRRDETKGDRISTKDS